MEILVLLAAIVLFAFFSGVRTMFAPAGKLRVEPGRMMGGLQAKAASFLLRHPDETLATLIVGSCISLAVFGIFSVLVVDKYFSVNGLPDTFFGLPTQIVTAVLIILLVGEFFPNALFQINLGKMFSCVLPLLICYFILYPVSKVFVAISRLFRRMSGTGVDKGLESGAGKVELDYLLQTSIENVGDDDAVDEEVKIFRNALDFSNVRIRDCIVPRTEVVAVDLNASAEDLKNLFVESGLSKIIVYDGNMDNVVGYIHSAEMFRCPENWTDGVKQIPIVPETMSAHKLMKLFMQQKKTIAVVVDEFGGTVGIVSLEDLVEEILGDIEDEHDNTSYTCRQVAEHEYVLSARLEIEKVNETFGLDLPENDDYLTIGGLILNCYQNFPKLHEVVAVGKFHFKIMKLSNTKIELVRLKVME